MAGLALAVTVTAHAVRPSAAGLRVGARRMLAGLGPAGTGARIAVRGMTNRYVVRSLAVLVAVWFVASILSPAAEAQTIVNGIAEEWRRASLIWSGRLLRNAQRLFVLLAGFEVVASAMILLLKPKRLDEAAGGFVIKILIMSICFFCITSFELVVPRIYESFVAAGQQAAFVPNLNPARVAGLGVVLCGKIYWQAATGPLFFNGLTMIVVIIVALMVALAFTGIACQIVYSLVEGYVVMSAGVFFLGFASFRGTATLADNYINYLFYSGTKILVLYLLVPICVTVATGWANQLDNTAFFDFTGPLEILVGACVLCGLVMFLPGTFASRITGGASLGIAQSLRNN